MRRLGISGRSPISNIRHFINIMSSQVLGSQGSQGCRSRQCGNGIHRYRCHCSKAPLVRTVTSSCASSGHEKTSDETQDHKKLGKEVLQWDKLSEDEKNMYFAHKHACMNEKNSYIDPVTGNTVFTEEFLRKRGSCCGNGCRHCPYSQENVPEGRRKKFNSAFFI